MPDKLRAERETEVCAAIRGDREALCSLWRKNRGWVAAILLAHKPREVELEDLLQTVALTLVQRIGDVREAGAFRPWLRTVAVNTARAAGRRATTERRARLRPVCDGEQEWTGRDADSEGQELLAMAQTLAEGYREPLLLRCVKGMSYREISQVLGIPETTVETRIARGRRMLRDLARQRDGEPIVGSSVEGVVDV